MCAPEDRLMEVNLASVEELRCDVQAIRERIAQQVSQSERSLHKYIQFELLKAQSYLRNVSEKLAAHIDGDGRTDDEDQPKFKELPAGREEGSPTRSSSAGSSAHQSEGGKAQPEANAAQLDSNKLTKPPEQKPAGATGCPPTSRKMSRCHEGRGSSRSVAEGTNQASKVAGKSPLPKRTENGRAPKVHFNGKTSQWHQPSHGHQDGTQQSSALKPADGDKMAGGRKPDLNPAEPKSREAQPKRHSFSSQSQCRDKVSTAKFATVRLPVTINGSNKMKYSNVKSRFMRRHQDDEVRALFGL